MLRILSLILLLSASLSSFSQSIEIYNPEDSTVRNGTRKNFKRDPEPIYAIQYTAGLDLIYGVHRIYGSMSIGDHFCLDLGIGIANPRWAFTELGGINVSDDRNGRIGPAAAVKFRYFYLKDPLEYGPNIHIELGYFNVGYISSESGAPIGYNCLDAGFGFGHQGTISDHFLIGYDLTLALGMALPNSSNEASYSLNRPYPSAIVAFSFGYVY